MTALMIAAKEGLFTIANDLLKRGAYINIQDHKGDTPLIHAVKGEAFVLLPSDGATRDHSSCAAR